MLTEDQRALNGLLFARRMTERLVREEFTWTESPPSEPEPEPALSTLAAD